MKLIATLLLIFSSFFLKSVFALECGDQKPPESYSEDQKIQYWLDMQSACNKKLSENLNQQKTLKTAISVLDSKIRLTTAQINQTINQINVLEKEIAALTEVVSDLNETLDELTTIYLARVRESYKRRDPNSLILLLSSESFAKYFTRNQYLNVIKTRDQLILTEMTSAKLNYNAQKDAKVEKQKQVEELQTKLTSQQASLKAQQKSKNDLLAITRNDEKRYQTYLDQIQAEMEAINAIIAGYGSETEAGDVSQGQMIARVIQGSSCNSGGTHLHFTLSDKSIVKNPFNYLKPISHTNNSGGDPFNPSGSWEWPLSPTIELNQGYGVTSAVQHNPDIKSIYSFHNGIDIDSTTSLEVRAVQAGKLYRGSYTGKKGCTLRYVRVDHKDTDIDTFYLHINYF